MSKKTKTATAEAATEAIIEEIFSKFCVGK